jgi:hypothetical protein
LAGSYQQAKDAKTLIWNQDPKPGDTATWSGDRDRDGYATGFGTLTWYGANGTLYARYFGNMIHGKFNGPVNGHSKGTTAHAFFVEGKRTNAWSSGPVPSWTMSRPTPEPAIGQVVPPPNGEIPKPVEPTPAQFNPPPPSYNMMAAHPAPIPNGIQEGPGGPTIDVPSEGPDGAGSEQSVRAAGGPYAGKPKLEIDDSLRSLTGPPGKLPPAPLASPKNSHRPRAGSLPSNAPHLTKQEVMELADLEAQKRGFDLRKYQRPDPQFDSADNIWSLSYREKEPDDTTPGRYFIVTIDDKTKRTAVFPIANE